MCPIVQALKRNQTVVAAVHDTKIDTPPAIASVKIVYHRCRVSHRPFSVISSIDRMTVVVGIAHRCGHILISST